jgi:hypothetical protein
MPVRAEHTLRGAPDLHASVQLTDGFLIMLAIDTGVRRQE